MKIPPLVQSEAFNVLKSMRIKKEVDYSKKIPEPTGDKVAFSSTAKYLKKYATLPNDIKKVLSPKDGVLMLKDMERVAKGLEEKREIGEGIASKVYNTPFLNYYYLLILKNANDDTQLIYSKQPLGDSIWCDKDDVRMQIIQKA